ncbi:MAG: hydrolase [Sulfuriferula sp.]|nr:hydrolase [Sulfuriferula sp.]
MPDSSSPQHEYRAPSWLPGGNLQTLFPYFFADKPAIRYRRERWELPDGDFLDLDWADNAADAPLVVLFHGLEGHSRGFYALALMKQVLQRGWRGVVVHFRGCSGEPNRLPRAYFAGDSAEIDYILRRLRAQAPDATIYAVGVSLGGNALLKWLGEQGTAANGIIQAAVAISAPLDLTAAGNALDRGFNQLFYTRHFLSTLKQTALQKLERFPGLFDAGRVRAATTLREFDDVVTAPLHGYANADEYWLNASSKPGLIRISVPTLILNAKNDPFLPRSALPSKNEVSPAVTLQFPEQGGHVGFHSGPFPGNADWLPKRVLNYLQNYR